MPAADGIDTRPLGSSVARVTIELYHREDPIAGTLRAGGEPPECFLGWTGLLAALQRALGGSER